MAGAVPRVVTLAGPGLALRCRARSSARSPRGPARSSLNTPHNPTGKVFSRTSSSSSRSSAGEHDVVCITDEVYEHLVYEGRHVPMATLPGHAGAHHHDLQLREDLLADRLEDRLGGGAAGADRRRARRAPVHHLRHRHAAAARARPSRSPAGPEYYAELLADYRTRARLPGRASSRGIGFARARLRPGPTSSAPTSGRFGFDDDMAFVRHLIEKVGVAAIPPCVFYDRPELRPPLRPLRVLQEDGDAGAPRGLGTAPGDRL